jgi:uncharacterized repeat protein (TIGR04042 family)
MPVMHFNLRWPDGGEMRCYSPSSVVAEHFEAGRIYPLGEFMVIARQAMGAASDRVRAKYGFACSQAMDQLADIEHVALRFQSTADAQVQVTAFD